MHKGIESVGTATSLAIPKSRFYLQARRRTEAGAGHKGLIISHLLEVQAHFVFEVRGKYFKFFSVQKSQAASSAGRVLQHPGLPCTLPGHRAHQP